MGNTFLRQCWPWLFAEQRFPLSNPLNAQGSRAYLGECSNMQQGFLYPISQCPDRDIVSILRNMSLKIFHTSTNCRSSQGTSQNFLTGKADTSTLPETGPFFFKPVLVPYRTCPLSPSPAAPLCGVS